jgi:membrane fusion protein (multidrug efflux system)
LAEQSDSRPRPDLFREDAMRHHLGESDQGYVIRLSPAWTRWTYWFLLATVFFGLLYLVLGRVWVYESGPAIVQLSSRTSLTCIADGTVERVDVLPGQEVVAGEVLVRFRADRERAELNKIQQEFEQQLEELLRDPSNAAVGRELRRLRAERDLLRNKLDERLVRASHDGIVQDVRIREGQFLAAGSSVLYLVPSEPDYTFIAMLPGHAGPQLHVEMKLRLEITGYPYADVPTTIDRVGQQVIGPTEARRFLRPDVADSFPLTGPVVVVEGTLPGDTFFAGAQEYSLHDGMQATAEVKVRRERILLRLIPGLKRLRRDGNG